MNRLFIGIASTFFISSSLFCFSSCDDKKILYIQTEKGTYSSCYIYSSKTQSVYYNKDGEKNILDLELIQCEKIVRPATLYTERTINLVTNPYDYILKDDRAELQLSEIDILEEQLKQDQEDLEYYESDLYKEWEAMKLGFVNPQAVSQYSYLYTYSAALDAKLYMDVTYKLSEEKSISIKEKKNAYKITYYTYSYDNELKLSFEKRTIEIPVNQVTLIQYA